MAEASPAGVTVSCCLNPTMLSKANDALLTLLKLQWTFSDAVVSVQNPKKLCVDSRGGVPPMRSSTDLSLHMGVCGTCVRLQMWQMAVLLVRQ